MKWTAAEDDLVRAHYAKGGVRICAEFLPLRTLAAIRERASSLGQYYPKALGIYWGSKQDSDRLARFAIGTSQAPIEAATGYWSGADEMLRILLLGPAMASEFGHIPAKVSGLMHSLNHSLKPTQRRVISKAVRYRTRLGWLSGRRYELVSE
jgi:hypothetical protein